MQSLVKREVQVSYNAHIDLISQMVIDSLEVMRHRERSPIDPGNALYHRMLRQTGHSAALRRLLSADWQEQNKINTFGLFFTQKEADNNTIRDPLSEVLRNYGVIGRPVSVIGLVQEVDVLIVCDTLHSHERHKQAWEFIGKNFLEEGASINLRLVVFLG